MSEVGAIEQGFDVIREGNNMAWSLSKRLIPYHFNTEVTLEFTL
jgi:hypothetical protein